MGLDRKACRAHGLARADEPKRYFDVTAALPFDLALPHGVYKTVLGPVESIPLLTNEL